MSGKSLVFSPVGKPIIRCSVTRTECDIIDSRDSRAPFVVKFIQLFGSGHCLLTAPTLDLKSCGYGASELERTMCVLTRRPKHVFITMIDR